MTDENRRFPPPPPRPIPPRPNFEQTSQVQPEVQPQVAPHQIQEKQVEEKIEISKPKKEKIPLSEQSKNILFICGGAFSFVVALVCLILAIVI